MLVIRRIHVTYDLAVAKDVRNAVERAHAAHARACPVARTISSCVAVTTEIDYRS